MKLNTVVLAALVAAPSFAFAANFEIDPSHSSAQFSVKHLGVSNVRGEFDKVTGAINVDEKDITRSTVNATIDATTINTREPKRDDHLKSADFFDVAKHPTIEFKSTKVEKAGSDEKLKVHGNLTMRGVTKPVVLDVEFPATEVKDPWGNAKRGATATTTINRKDFGLNWNKALEAGGLLVGDEVKITIDLELNKKAAAPAQKKG